MAAHWNGVVVDSPDPSRLARFWASLLGYEVVEDSPGWVVTQAAGGARPLLACQGINSHVQHGAATPQSNKVHFDLGLKPGTPRTTRELRALESRLDELGARRVERVDVPGQEVHWIWADPDGNVFCAPGI